MALFPELGQKHLESKLSCLTHNSTQIRIQTERQHDTRIHPLYLEEKKNNSTQFREMNDCIISPYISKNYRSIILHGVTEYKYRPFIGSVQLGLCRSTTTYAPTACRTNSPIIQPHWLTHIPAKS